MVEVNIAFSANISVVVSRIIYSNTGYCNFSDYSGHSDFDVPEWFISIVESEMTDAYNWYDVLNPESEAYQVILMRVDEYLDSEE